MTTYGYIRVSTEKQSYQHMEYEISEYAAKNKMKIDEWIEETISSRKPLHKRKLGELLDKLQPNDILITSELSRISRSVPETFSILQICLNKNCEVITIKENYHLGNDLQSQVLAFAFSACLCFWIGSTNRTRFNFAAHKVFVSIKKRTRH